MDLDGYMVIALIPARYDSKRFPGKLLSLYEGRSVLDHTYRRAVKCPDISACYVVTGDDIIADHCKSLEIPCLTTTDSYVCGSDRCIGAYQKFNLEGDILMNVQADQPLLDPKMLTDLIAYMKTSSEATICSLMSAEQCTSADSNVVKVSVDEAGCAVDFTRELAEGNTYHHHIGVYGFKSSVLADLSTYEPSTLEVERSLEQMRWLEKGHKIHMVAVDHHPQSIDTLEQLEALRK